MSLGAGLAPPYELARQSRGVRESLDFRQVPDIRKKTLAETQGFYLRDIIHII